MTRVIKRYANRKLYDADAKAYVSLEEIAALVRSGETVQVVDQTTGDDITAQTLTQVILDEGKRGTSLLPTDLLHGLLRRGTKGVSSIRHAVDDAVHGAVAGIRSVLPVARQEEIEQLRAQLASVEKSLGPLLEQQQQPPAPRAKKPRKPKP